MVRTYKDDVIHRFRVKYIDAGYSMVFAQVPKIAKQYMGYGKNKTQAKAAVTKNLRQYLKHNS